MRMDRQVMALIQQYGQGVEVLWKKEFATGLPPLGEQKRSKAMVQLIRNSAAEESLNPLGKECLQKYLYLGEAKIACTESLVRWQGRMYEVLSASPVYVGTYLSYWRGVLKESPWQMEEREEVGGEEIDG